jgi:hypothetical protein
MKPEESPLSFQSSDKALNEGFAWAKAQALAYVFRGDPVGDWYEAALPGREAFCMRDTAHQAAGARALGLQAVTRNMLHAFARNVSEPKGWCTWWEIDRRGRPCSADYTSDADFWYNLPASFDLLRACVREYLGTGDRTYVDDPAFLSFHEITLGRYIETWDRDGDGIPEHQPADGIRGIGSYYEGRRGLACRVGGDLVALQYAAFRAGAVVREMKGDPRGAEDLRRRAADLKALYSARWWDPVRRCPKALLLQDGSFSDEDLPELQVYPLLCGILDGERAERALDAVEHAPRPDVEGRSYLPETLYAYGRAEPAAAELRALMAPGLKRREYPEVSFAVIGAVAGGMMGVEPDARQNVVSTMPQLDTGTAWAAVDSLPALGTTLAIRHDGTVSSTCRNVGGSPFVWKASFPGHHEILVVDGKRTSATREQALSGRGRSSVLVRLEPGGETAVHVP